MIILIYSIFAFIQATYTLLEITCRNYNKTPMNSLERRCHHNHTIFLRIQLHYNNPQEMIRPTLTPYSSSLSSRGYCNICYNPYDLELYKPLLICSNQHSVCKVCLLAIRKRLRCPFCRETVTLHRIRINKAAVDLIIAKSRKGSQLSINSKKQPEYKALERIITEHTDQDNQIYLDEAQFISINGEESLPVSGCKAWIVLLYVYLLGLHLPVGACNVYLALSQPKSSDCLDVYLPDSNYSLRYQWESNGFLQILVAVLALYFMVSHYLQILHEQGLRMFQFLLVFFGQTLSLISFFVYVKLITNQTLYLCSGLVGDAVMANLVVKSATLVLGVYLLGKFYGFIFER